jgi:hypothetical protein
VSGEEVDRVGEPTALTKEWDSKTQQLVLRVESVSFREVYKLTPEKQNQRVPLTQPADPLASVFRDAPPPARPPTPVEEFTPTGTTLDDGRNSELERQRRVRHAAAVIRAELARNKRERQEIA